MVPASDRGRTLRDEEVVRLTLTHLDTLTRDKGPRPDGERIT